MVPGRFRSSEHSRFLWVDVVLSTYCYHRGVRSWR